MVEEGLIDKEDSSKSCFPLVSSASCFAPILDGKYIRDNSLEVITRGLNASPGGACGQIYFTAEKAEEMAAEGKDVILVRTETSPEDIGGMGCLPRGVVTCRGGMTSHAAVVGPWYGLSLVSVALGRLRSMSPSVFLEVNGTKLSEGDFISIDGFYR